MGRPWKLTLEQVSQILGMLRDGASGVECARRFKVNSTTICYWQRYLRIDAERLGYLRELEHRALFQGKTIEKQRRQLEAAKSALIDLIPSSHRRSVWARRMREPHGLTYSWANEVFGLSTSAGRRAPPHDDEAEIVRRMREHAARHRGHGFRRMLRLAFPEQPCSLNRLNQLYRESNLQLVGRHKRPATVKPRAEQKRTDVPSSCDVMWSVDWMMVKVAGRRAWVLNVIDDCNRECIVSRAFKRASAANLVAAMGEATASHKPA